MWFRRFIRAARVALAIFAKGSEGGEREVIHRTRSSPSPGTSRVAMKTLKAIVKGWLGISPPRFPTLMQLFWAFIVLCFVYVEFRIVLPVGLDEVLGEVTLDRVWYSLRYQTDINHVAVDRKPHDCDFDKAPIGNKECHYQRIVGTVKETDGKTSVYAGWQKVED
jgi:hypothetical protein